MKKNLRVGEQGQTLVESALSLSLLLLLLFGAIAGGMILNTYHTLSYAARLGSRFAIVRGSHCSGGLSGGCPAADTDVATFVKSSSFVGVDGSQLTVTTTWSAPPTGGSCPSLCNDPGDQVTVNVTYPLSAFHFPLVPAMSGAMHSSSTMVISQ